MLPRDTDVYSDSSQDNEIESRLSNSKIIPMSPQEMAEHADREHKLSLCKKEILKAEQFKD